MQNIEEEPMERDESESDHQERMDINTLESRRSNQALRRQEILARLSPSSIRLEGTKRNWKPKVDPYFQTYVSIKAKPNLVHVSNTMDKAKNDRLYRIH